MDEASLAVMEKNGASNTAGSWLMVWMPLAGSFHCQLAYFHQVGVDSIWKKGNNDRIPYLAPSALPCRIHRDKPDLPANRLQDFVSAP